MATHTWAAVQVADVLLVAQKLSDTPQLVGGGILVPLAVHAVDTYVTAASFIDCAATPPMT
ncbi:MAG: hypothetical protein NVS1B6_11980 [Steroidobacteraceae bacterium]